MSQFFDPDFNTHNPFLNKEESHHCIAVFRRQKGDIVKITNGKGILFTGQIKYASKSSTEIQITDIEDYSENNPSSHICISPPKSRERIEWFVEKVTEIGVGEISFVKTEYSERFKINLQRLHKKAIGALKQSENTFLPTINPEIALKEFLDNFEKKEHSYYADKEGIKGIQNNDMSNSLIIVGPEGGLSETEKETLEALDFKPICLGNAVLRTETAGILSVYEMSKKE